MEKRTTQILYWMTSLILLGICAYYTRAYDPVLMRGMVFGTLAVTVGTVLVVGWRTGWSNLPTLPKALGALVLVEFSLAITAGAVTDLPPSVVTRATVKVLHLGPFYHLTHYALTAYIVAVTLARRDRLAVAEAGLLAIVTYSVLNGSFFHLTQTDRSALLYGLTLSAGLSYIAGHDSASQTKDKDPDLRALNWPVLLLVIVGGLATATSLHVQSSLGQWLGLVHWILLYLLIAGIVRERDQIDQLLLAMVAMGMFASIAGLIGLVNYASQTGWDTALRSRLWIGYMHSNGSATWAATLLVLSVGLFVVWRSRWRRVLLGLNTILLALCILLTLSRSAAIGLFVGLAFLLLLLRSEHTTLRKWWRAGLLLLVPLLLVGSAVLIRDPAGVLQSRISLWKVAFNTIRHRPLLGVGPNNHLVPAFVDVLTLVEVRNIQHLVDTHTHNLLLEIAQGMGILGLVAFLWLVVAVGRYAWRAIGRATGNDRRALLVVLSAGAITLMLPHLLVLSLSEATLLPASLWILLGLSVAAGRVEKPALPEGRFGKWRAPLLGAGVLVGALLFVARPLVAEMWIQRGLGALEAGLQEEAEGAFLQATRLEPWDDEPWAVLGEMATHSSTAIERYQQAVELRPYYAPYRTQIGWLHWLQNEPELATEAFEEALAIDIYGLDGRLHQLDLGLIYAATGRRDKSLDAFQTALLLDPSIVNSIWRPDWYVAEEGVALDPAYTRYAQTGQVDEELSSRIRYHLGRPGAAIADFQTVGEPQVFLEDVAAGILAEVERVEETDRAQARDMLLRLCGLYLDWELYPEFEHTLEAARALTEPGTLAEAMIHRLQGTAYQRQGQLELAQSELETVVELADEPAFHYHLGTIYLQRELIDEGISALEFAANHWDPSVIRGPGWSAYWRDLADAYVQAGWLEDALAAYKKAQFLAESIQDYLQVQLSLGQVHRQQGDYEQETAAYAYAVQVLADLDYLDSQEMEFLTELAIQAADAYRGQGLNADAALEAHEQMIDRETRVGRAYLEVFRREMVDR